MIATAYSQAPRVKDAVREIEAQLGVQSGTPALVLFFASTIYPPADLAESMQQSFPGACVIGCTSAGEIASGMMLTDSLVAMSFDHDTLSDVAVEVVVNPADREQVKKAFVSFEQQYATEAMALDIDKYVGLVFCDGLSGAEERLMEALGDFTNVTFVGGSAGDDLKFQRTSVFAHGQAYSNAAVLTLFRPLVPFKILKTQSFQRLDCELTPTRVNHDTREVIEIGGLPAIQAYARALGTTELEVSDYFMSNPLGLMIEGEPFVRSLQRVMGESLIFFCRVDEGVPLWLLESTDIIKETKQQLSTNLDQMGGASAVLVFNCILRTLELEHKGLLEDYGKLFEKLPAIGFSTYGEAYLGHVNQTATMLLMGHGKRT